MGASVVPIGPPQGRAASLVTNKNRKKTQKSVTVSSTLIWHLYGVFDYKYVSVERIYDAADYMLILISSSVRLLVY